MTLYCKTTSYPGFCITVTCYYSSALERVINVNLSVCNLVPRSSLFVTSVWDSVCFLLCCRWVMRSFACASKASPWTRSLRAMWSPASKTSAISSSDSTPGRKVTCTPHRFTASEEMIDGHRMWHVRSTFKVYKLNDIHFNGVIVALVEVVIRTNQFKSGHNKNDPLRLCLNQDEGMRCYAVVLFI